MAGNRIVEEIANSGGSLTILAATRSISVINRARALAGIRLRAHSTRTIADVPPVIGRGTDPSVSGIIDLSTMCGSVHDAPREEC